MRRIGRHRPIPATITRTGGRASSGEAAKTALPTRPTRATSHSATTGDLAATAPATNVGPTMKMSSWTVASTPNSRCRRSGCGTMSGHSPRAIALIGGEARPPAAASRTKDVPDPTVVSRTTRTACSTHVKISTRRDVVCRATRAQDACPMHAPRAQAPAALPPRPVEPVTSLTCNSTASDAMPCGSRASTESVMSRATPGVTNASLRCRTAPAPLPQRRRPCRRDSGRRSATYPSAPSVIGRGTVQTVGALDTVPKSKGRAGANRGGPARCEIRRAAVSVAGARCPFQAKPPARGRFRSSLRRTSSAPSGRRRGWAARQ